MWAARALVWYRLSKLGRGLHRIEPFVGGSVLDASSASSGDRAWELSGGVAWSLTSDVRLQLHARRQELGDPVIFGTAGTTQLFVQVGTVFEQ
jgi:hypothetical protein